MDIIASHQQGLVEQLEIEAASLAGRPRDLAQRAVVYHHLADSLGLANVYALLAAEAALAIDGAVAAMVRKVRASWWRMGSTDRAALIGRVERFGDSLRELDRRRCEAALLTYRLIATPGLAAQAQARVAPDLYAAFCASHCARGAADGEMRLALFLTQQRWAEELIGAELEAALLALDWPFGGATVRRAVATLRLPLSAFQRAKRRGLARIEAAIRANKALPPAFASNPAQAFYAMQRRLAEQRRRAAVDIEGLSPDEAVSLAA